MNNLAPALFISHGSPTFALEPGKLGARLRAVGESLDGVRALLVVSPHWQTHDVQVMTTAMPRTVHDFGGFPAALYRLQYPAPGAPELAQEAARLLVEAGFTVGLDADRGLDHGAWVPLLHLLPDADLPVFQVSMPYTMTPAEALQLGAALAPLRRQGIAIVGSGSMTHNLHEFRQAAKHADPYVMEFVTWVRETVRARALTRLANYRSNAPHATRAHPTDEHFLPLLVALGASDDQEVAQLLDDTVTYGILSMESYAWGLAA